MKRRSESAGKAHLARGKPLQGRGGAEMQTSPASITLPWIFLLLESRNTCPHSQSSPAFTVKETAIVVSENNYNFVLNSRTSSMQETWSGKTEFMKDFIKSCIFSGDGGIKSVPVIMTFCMRYFPA